MTKGQIIEKAQLYLDDTSDLSDAEFSDLFDKFYRLINGSYLWEYNKAEGTGTTSTSVPYIALEDGFLFLTQNYNYTDASEHASRPVVFRGPDFAPYKVVSWSDRRRYRNNEGYAYIDFANNRLYFTKQPTTAEAVEYDFHKQAAVLALDEEPVFPAEFHDQIYHMMVSDDMMIQQSPKAKSYANENRAAAGQITDDMKFWNSQLIQM